MTRSLLAAALMLCVVLVLGGCTIFGAVIGGAIGAAVGGAEGAAALGELGLYVGAGIDGAIIGDLGDDRPEPYAYPPHAHTHAGGSPPVILIRESEPTESGRPMYTYEYAEDPIEY